MFMFDKVMRSIWSFKSFFLYLPYNSILFCIVLSILVVNIFSLHANFITVTLFSVPRWIEQQTCLLLPWRALNLTWKWRVVAVVALYLAQIISRDMAFFFLFRRVPRISRLAPYVLLSYVLLVVVIIIVYPFSL